ncbi:hypothetical protein JIP62_04860 [Brevundimonas vitis]|uniref:Flagellar protein FlaG n=1 Tax=Brevundimonas vitisensis TaxID=2800818 RepID=A0ABX7BRA1_9CAUL|nr:hypothetical protein [Brevundimonas vitisensis]QQQ20168.1 hypothetical protein JIP62_04860 [Brevundimonas vitisensis]
MTPNAKIGLVPPVTPASGASAGGDFAQSRTAQDAERLSRYRLVIEEGSRPGSFIYKTLDRVTGEVVRQLPREQIVEALSAGHYTPGSAVDVEF